MAFVKAPPICDLCAKDGITKIRMEPGSYPPLPDPTFACVGHGRLYHPFVGYRGERQADLVLAFPCTQGCGGLMYIASVENGAMKLICPECSHEDSKPVSRT